MIQTFSEYLETIRIQAATQTIEALRSFAISWIDSVLDELWNIRKEFFHIITIPLLRGGDAKSHKTQLHNNFQTWIETLEKEVFEEELNKFFLKYKEIIEQEAVNHLSFRPLVVNSRFYPFKPLESNQGVQMVCRLRLDEKLLEVPFSKDNMYARSAIGDTGDEQKRYARENIGKTARWIQPLFDELKITLDYQKHVDKNSPHAEDIWIIKYGQNLVEFLKNNRLALSNTRVSDHFPLSYLLGPRIEFVISSSPCEGCIPYFRALRKAFDANKIQLPIVIFTNRHTNTNEKDCAVFIIDNHCNYIQLPAQWNGELIRKNAELKRHVSPPVDLSDTYKTTLTLKIFGDALLPRLSHAKPVIILSFLQSLLDHRSTNYLMVDWMRYYFYRVLTLSSFDFSSTAIKSDLSNPRHYKMIDYRFLLECETIPGMLDYSKELVQLTIKKPDNVVGFFMILCKNWNDMICKFLTNGSIEKVRDLHVSRDLTQTAMGVNAAVTWNLSSAPEEVVMRNVFDEKENVSIFNSQVNELWCSISLTWGYIHFLGCPPQFQRNILNFTLTHPSRSPLPRKDNESYSDERMTEYIEDTLKGIKKIAFHNGCWNMPVIERIFKGLEQEKTFDPELQQAVESIRKQDKRKRLPTLTRVFPREQVKSAGTIWIVNTSEDCQSEENVLPFESKNVDQGSVRSTNKRLEVPRNKQMVKVARTGNHPLSALEIADEVLKRVTRSSLSSLSLFSFRKLHEEFVTEHRHEDPRIQRDYDERFGLMLI